MSLSRTSNHEFGFTLVELLVIIAIIGILASLALTGWSEYKGRAALAVVETGVHDAQTAFEAGISNEDSLPGNFALLSQTDQGPLSNGDAATLLPGFRVPRNTKFQASYNNTCAVDTDTLGYMQLNHCSGDQYVTWERFCDGVIIRLTVAGGGCP